MRIFVGLALPQAVKASLAILCQNLIPTARWEHPDDFHLTLRFIGNVDDVILERYKQALLAVQSAPFTLTLESVGCFPPSTAKPPTVLWVGVQPSAELMDLQRSVSSVLEKAGLPKDRYEDYSPHITLARLKAEQRTAEITGFLKTHAAFHSEPIPVTGFTLFQSKRLSNGANYSPIELFPFSQPNPTL